MRNLVSILSAVALSLSLSIAASGCATSDASSDDTYGEDESEAAGAGTFSLLQSNDGQYRFHLKSGNGAVLLSSEGYATRTGAINGILSVQENGVDSLRYEVAAVTSGFVVHLLAGNREIIAFSQRYASKSSAARA